MTEALFLTLGRSQSSHQSFQTFNWLKKYIDLNMTYQINFIFQSGNVNTLWQNVKG